MKEGNKNMNAGRSEEFALAGQGNTAPSSLQFSPEGHVSFPSWTSLVLLWLSFPSVSKLHPLKVFLASGTRVHTGNEMKHGKLGSNRSCLILLHNGDEQYLHNNILGC